VVLYGGVSLAVYIHGVTREILNLVKASQLFHIASGASRPNDETVAVYYDLFKEMRDIVDIRVVVDLISGASAGGINGVMLARAIAHDLPLQSHRNLWLRNADVTQLSEPGNIVSRAAKALLAPAFDLLLARRFGQGLDDPETRAKLRQFIQLRWFTPPFSGRRFSGWMIDACDHMQENAKPGASLLPPGHRLDLFVTLTDYHGHRHKIALHDPPSVVETEHRRIVAFSCQRALSGEMASEFTVGDVPSLVFSARATASFPGAFHPATITEMDQIVESRGRSWPARHRLVVDKLAIASDHVADRYFIDGSVVMNKPFGPVIRALGNRPANREVARRIVYVDPNPHQDRRARPRQSSPGFFRTVLASLALIPRNEPIADDLQSIQDWNIKARRMAEILAAADPQVAILVDEIAPLDPNNPPGKREVAAFRKAANEKAHEAAGFAYLSYQTLKLRRLVDRLSGLIADLAKPDFKAADAAAIERMFDRWTRREGGPMVPFLRGFDIDFRLRRVRFVIRRLNELYRTMDDVPGQTSTKAIDELKTALYEVIDRAQRLWDPKSHKGDIRQAAVRIATSAAEESELDLDDLGVAEKAMDLLALDDQLDEIVSLMGLAYLPPIPRRAVAMAYVGFAFYDPITFPILQWTEMDEINEVLVDRISPADARALKVEKGSLKGVSLMSFGAFFNRSWREHDYLWGRINAADRLIDILTSAIGQNAIKSVDLARLRQRLFQAIVDEEEQHLRSDPGLIPSIRRKIAQMLEPA
jgi:patatin-related protein